MKKSIRFILCMLIVMNMILFSLFLISGEQTFWTDTLIKPDQNIVRYHSFYQFDDTSINNQGKQQPIQITILANAFSLPYNLTYGVVDYCNYTVQDIKNTYTGTDLVNSTTIKYSYYHTANTLFSNTTTFILYDKDSLIIDMDCHYTDSRSLFQENVLVGRFTTFFSAYQCEKCSDFTLEQLSKQTEQNDNITQKELSLYNNIQKGVDYNYKIWNIISWIIKIALVVGSVMLIFSGVYWVYKYFKEIGVHLR